MARPYRAGPRLHSLSFCKRPKHAVTEGPQAGRARWRLYTQVGGWIGVLVAWNCLLAGCQRSDSGVPKEYREWDRSGESAEKEILQMPKDS